MTTEDGFPVGTTGEGEPAARPEVEACLRAAGSFVVELVEFVAEATDEEPTDLPPLSDAVDPEAVQRLLASDDSESATVRFHYADCEIVVTGSGAMVLLT